MADEMAAQVEVPAPDVNPPPKIMAWMSDEYSRRCGPTPAVITGKPVVLGGSLGRDAATGRGSFICLDHLAKSRQWLREETTAAIQGYGNAGSWLGLIPEERGYPVIAVSGSRGAAFNPKGR